MKKAFFTKTLSTLVAVATVTTLKPLGVSAEWKENYDKTWNYTENNTIAKGWKNISNSWYYFDAYGKMETNWVCNDGIWYYLNDSGVMQVGWLKDNGNWYYLDNSGAMQTGSRDIDDKIYYFSQSGELYQNDNATIYVDGLPQLPQSYQISIQYSAESEILKLMNEKRTEAGLKPLILDDNLLKIARYKSDHMIQFNYFDHTTPEGNNWTSWLKAIGYTYSTTGENIAYNNYEPVELFNQWWNSPEHRENMMNPAYNKVGIGVINGNDKYMGTQTFSN